jgi:stress response protein YsnF
LLKKIIPEFAAFKHQGTKTFSRINSPTNPHSFFQAIDQIKLIACSHMKTIDTASQNSPSPYNSLIGTTVFDRNGNRANISSLYQKEGATIAVLTTEDGRSVDADLADLERHEGSFTTPVLLNPHDEERPSPQTEWHEEMKIPVASEEINVGRRSIDTGKGIRVKKHVLEHDEIVNVPHVEESLSVRHIEAGQIVSQDKLPQARQEGDTYIIPVFEEVYVVEKRIRLKEEIHITRKRTETKEDQKIKLRSEKVDIERFDDTASRD